MSKPFRDFLRGVIIAQGVMLLFAVEGWALAFLIGKADDYCEVGFLSIMVGLATAGGFAIYRLATIDDVNF